MEKELANELELNPKEADPCCGMILYEDLPLPMMMVQGWFSDQHACFELFFEQLSHQERTSLFVDESTLESVKRKYRQLRADDQFTSCAKNDTGVHKRLGQLEFKWFAWWAGCVSRAVRQEGSLESLLDAMATVEAAHDRFKPWFYRTKRVRNLNAADAARLLARYGHLLPEERPLLARGSLRGAALLLNDEPHWKGVDRLDEEYQLESRRRALEEKAAEYITASEELSSAGEWRMEEGENWFCNVVHKEWYPEHTSRPRGR